MPLYVIERQFAEQLEVTRESAAEVRLINDDVGVHCALFVLVRRQAQDLLPVRSEHPGGDPGSRTPRQPAGRCDHRGQRTAPGGLCLTLAGGARSPCRIAKAAASVRLLAPTFARMFRT
jgi:hypothetical protein